MSISSNMSDVSVVLNGEEMNIMMPLMILLETFRVISTLHNRNCVIWHRLMKEQKHSDIPTSYALI